MFCRSCGTEMKEDKTFCPNCGEKTGNNLVFVYNETIVSENYAGFLDRLKAMLVDMAIMVAVNIILSIILPAKAISGVLGLLTMGYYIYFESSEKQGTIGKQVIGLTVVDKDGQRIGVGKAALRYFSRILSSILFIGYIMVAFTAKKQGLHDMIAGTYVVKK